MYGGGGVRTFQKLSHLGGTNFLLERKDKPEKRRGRGVDVEMGMLPSFYYFFMTVHVGKVKLPLLFFGSSVF